MSCGCEAVADREGWHYYRRTKACPLAAETRRERDRAKYARRRAREGVIVKPMRPRTSAVNAPEVDPL